MSDEKYKPYKNEKEWAAAHAAELTRNARLIESVAEARQRRHDETNRNAETLQTAIRECRGKGRPTKN